MQDVTVAGPDTDAFGIDAFTLDDRLRLFHFAAAEKRHEYLWLLRAFDRSRANYQVLMHARPPTTTWRTHPSSTRSAPCCWSGTAPS